LTPKILHFLIFMSIGHVLVWLQSSGQLIWQSFRNNIWLLCLLGIPLAYLFITATRIGYEVFDQKLWPVRILGFNRDNCFQWNDLLFLRRGTYAQDMHQSSFVRCNYLGSNHSIANYLLSLWR